MRVVYLLVLIASVIGFFYNGNRLQEAVNAEKSFANRLFFGDIIQAQGDSAMVWIAVCIFSGIISLLLLIFTAGGENKENNNNNLKS